MNQPDRNISNEMAIFNLWLNWVIAFGALCIPNIISVYTPAIVVPIVTFALGGAILLYNHQSLRSRSAVCPLIPTIVYRSLFVSGLIMMLILVTYSHGIIDRFYETELLNRKIPFLTVLIISPVTLANSLWAHVRGKRYGACQMCQMMLGTSSERGFIGKLFMQESRYQRYFIIAISSVLTLASYTYYASFYVNVNINTPDKFFLGWVPVILYLISIIYLATRYFTIWAYYYQNLEREDHNSSTSTTLRFLIINGDSMYLSRHDEFFDIPDLNKYDTPAMLTYSYRKKVTLDMASRVFSDMSQIQPDEFTIRFMYYTEDSTGGHNVFHFICSPNTPEIMSDHSMFKGSWYNLSQLERLLHNRELSPMLASEIHRLYTVAMAWKTYDSDGRRLYKVKNYRPVFRLKGICDWDVDFNSHQWLRVAQLNEDKPFFRLRRLLRRLGGGDAE